MSIAAAPSVICDEFPAVMSGAVSGSNDCAGASEASRSKVVSLRMPSSVREELVGDGALVVTDGDGDGLLGEVARVRGRGGASVALERVLVHVLARDLPLLGQELGHPELHPQPALDDVEERLRERARPAPGVRGQRDAAHGLHAAGDGEVVVARHHTRGREVDGLLGRPALAVDGRGRDRLGQSRRHPGVAGHVGGLLAHLADTAADDVVDALGVDPGVVHEMGQGEGEEVDGMPIGQGPAPLAERGPTRVDDDCFAHCGHRQPFPFVVIGPLLAGRPV